MQDEHFSRLVAEEVKGRVSQEQSDYLRLPDNWTRWQRALIALIETLNRQLEDISESEKRDIERYKALGDTGIKLLAEKSFEYESRAKKIQRFRFHVEMRLDEVTKMIMVGSEAVDDRIKAVDFLRKAVEKHREMMIAADLEISPVDEALYAALNGKWTFDDIDIASLS